jgi:hypothetical protein
MPASICNKLSRNSLSDRPPALLTSMLAAAAAAAIASDTNAATQAANKGGSRGRGCLGVTAAGCRQVIMMLLGWGPAKGAQASPPAGTPPPPWRPAWARHRGEGLGGPPPEGCLWRSRAQPPRGPPCRVTMDVQA